MSVRTSRAAPERRLTWAAGLLFCGIAACSAPPVPPEGDLFSQANHEFERRDFVMAAQFYDKLLEQYPFSDNAETARLRIAHAYYLGGEYEKAIAAFNDFERLHPTSEALAFVEYSVGMAYLDQARPLDRDKAATENAKLQFQRVLSRYGDTLYGRLAAFRIAQCDELLAGHELKVGEYYASIGKEKAALSRYRYLVAQYPQTDAAVEARRRLPVTDPSGEPRS
ncbi:MAG TPA: outer membrane protein assembly factor BamD [Candidatus Binatia bacterium]|nr:outer membrane protein assembly factor BamD [Candidatus Binatia bacterium]